MDGLLEGGGRDGGDGWVEELKGRYERALEELGREVEGEKKGRGKGRGGKGKVEVEGEK